MGRKSKHKDPVQKGTGKFREIKKTPMIEEDGLRNMRGKSALKGQL